MTDPVVNALCALVDAVLIEHCLPCKTEGIYNEGYTISCALDALRKIRAAPEFSSLHSWADKRLPAHKDDADGYDDIEACQPPRL
jgi:hypothetical protein